jgi:hypothetical protein
MATRTIARLYDTHEDAVAVVRDLEAAGIPHDRVSIVAPNYDERYATEPAGSGAGAGATIGTIIGGGAGLLAGIGAIAIPGVGPVVAAGWLVALITGAGIGAAAGGLLGSLTGSGVAEDEAHVYAEGVRRGGSLVTVRMDEAEAPRVEQIMAAYAPVDWQTREADYRAAGWDRFDPAAPAYSAEAIERERDRVRARM